MRYCIIPMGEYPLGISAFAMFIRGSTTVYLPETAKRWQKSLDYVDEVNIAV